MAGLGVSFLFAYVLLGISRLIADLTADAMHRPAWTGRPTPGLVLFIFGTWPLRTFYDVRNPSFTHSLFKAFVAIAAQMGTIALFIYAVTDISGLFFQGIWNLAVSTAVCLIALPVLPALSFVVVLIIGTVLWPIEVLFWPEPKAPMKWCKECRFYKKSPEYEDHMRGLWRSDTFPGSKTLPCSIYEKAWETWEDYFALNPEARPLYPKDCILFEKRP